ncbi:hypothetical protein, partial [Proteus mirabilis]|uniref:hypothetical protein n=1 Tax=Proteus mirabilis TaxID=584 RepID=UPI00313B6435
LRLKTKKTRHSESCLLILFSVCHYQSMVREARLELAHLAAPDPKSGASTNFATPETTFEKKRLV